MGEGEKPFKSAPFSHFLDASFTSPAWAGLCSPVLRPLIVEHGNRPSDAAWTPLESERPQRLRSLRIEQLSLLASRTGEAALVQPGTITLVDTAANAFVLTISDRCAGGEREDASGPAVAKLLQDAGFPVTARRVIPDEQTLIEAALREAARTHRLVVTTGGTGLTSRDVTPEATRAVCERLLDGLAERMRAEGLHQTPFAILSRGLAGTLGRTLILNLPGAPRGAQTSLQAVLPVLHHAIELLADPQTPHPMSSLSADPAETFSPPGDSFPEISGPAR